MINFEIFVVIDDPQAAIPEPWNAIANLTTLRNKENRGPAYSRNQGVRAASGDKLIFLDADVVPSQKTLCALMQSLDNYDYVIGCYDDDSFHKANFWTRFYHYRIVYGHYAHRGPVRPVLAAILAIRMSVFVEVNGFCESYVAASVEDVDLSIRLAQRSYRSQFLPEAKVLHSKTLSLPSLIRNDYLRSRDRVHFLFRPGMFKGLMTGRSFDHSSSGQGLALVSGLITLGLLPVLLIWRDPISAVCLAAFFLVFTTASMGHLSFYRKKGGVMFSVQSLLFSLCDSLVICCGIAVGFLRYRKASP